jgi:hypothetical protein
MPSSEEIEALERYPAEGMPTLERDGNVAVVYSPGYGAGFWHLPDCLRHLRRHAALAEAAERGNFADVCERMGLYDMMGEFGGDQAALAWVPKGARYMIGEYDGYESVVVEDKIKWDVA